MSRDIGSSGGRYDALLCQNISNFEQIPYLLSCIPNGTYHIRHSYKNNFILESDRIQLIIEEAGCYANCCYPAHVCSLTVWQPTLAGAEQVGLICSTHQQGLVTATH